MVSLTMSARGVAGAEVDDRRGLGATIRLGRTARGRPSSPLLGVHYVVAMWWVAFGSALLQQWACG